MSTPQDVINDLKFAIAAALPGWAGQFTSAYDNTLGALADGETRYQLQFQMQAPFAQSNVKYQVMAIEVHPSHFLSNFVVEELYTRDVMVDDQIILLDAGLWRDLDSVYDISTQGDNRPEVELTTDVTRVGNVITYGVLAVVLVVP